MIHDNSILSYHEHKEKGKLSSYRDRIFDILAQEQRPMTDREIYGLIPDAFDFNNVRPEITRLIQRGMIYEVDRVVCPVTKKKVRRTSCLKIDATGQKAFA